MPLYSNSKYSGTLFSALTLDFLIVGINIKILIRVIILLTLYKETDNAGFSEPLRVVELR